MLRASQTRTQDTVLKHLLSNRKDYFCILVGFPRGESEAIFALSHVFPSGQDFKLVTYLRADQIVCTGTSAKT